MRKTKKTYRKRLTKARDVGDYASCSVKRTIVPDAGGNFATNQMYDMRQTSLNTFQRAMTIARAYQHYRIKKITLTLKPTYDTYQSGAPGGSSKANLFFMIDKSGSIPANPTLEALKQMGAKAHAFDEKPKTISWRPSVLNAALDNAGAPESSQYRISPWLSTSTNPINGPWVASDIDHLGVFWYVEQLFGGGLQYNAEIEVQFQFKKPLYVSAPSAAPAVHAVVATEDDSSDGILQGPDSNNLIPTQS